MREWTVRARRARLRSIASLLLAMLVATPSPAVAAEPSTPSKRALAEALFDAGLRLMKQGDFTQGCAKLEQSQEMDPAVGTLLYLAECYERVGRTASAWATFREAASMARASGQEARARTGQERAERIEPQLSRLSIEVASENASIRGFEVIRAGEALPKAVWGSSLPIDPGEVTVEARAPGYERWTTSVTVGATGDQRGVTVPPLARSAADSGRPGAGTPRDDSRAPEGDDGSDSPPRTQRTLAFAAGAAGVVGLGIGSYYGLRAISRNDEARDLCAENDVCSTRRGVVLTEEAREAARVSNVAFAAGGVLLAGAVILFVTAPARPTPVRVSAGLQRRGGALLVRGEF